MKLSEILTPRVLNEGVNSAVMQQVIYEYVLKKMKVLSPTIHFSYAAELARTTEAFYTDKFEDCKAAFDKAESIEEIPPDQIERTFRTNVFSMFYLTRAALKHLRPGSTIINTTSVTAYRGSPTLLDYSATKGAIVAFTRSLSQALIEKGIRVNAVAPGPIWTPLIPSTFPPEKVATFGSDKPMGRAGQPSEVAPCYVFLAANDSSYMSGQVLHPNGDTNSTEQPTHSPWQHRTSLATPSTRRRRLPTE